MQLCGTHHHLIGIIVEFENLEESVNISVSLKRYLKSASTYLTAMPGECGL